MNDEKSVTAGTKPRSRLRKLKTHVYTKRAVIRIVPISASNAAFLSVMLGVSRLPVTAATLAPALGLLASLKRRRATRGSIFSDCWERLDITMRTFTRNAELDRIGDFLKSCKSLGTWNLSKIWAKNRGLIGLFLRKKQKRAQ